MEAATLPEQESGAEKSEAENTNERLFRYSDWLHVGIGAKECESATDGKCKDEGHFHAWVCLPNALQQRDIQEKAKAAKARRQRAMRDAGLADRGASDAYVTLEAELDELLEESETIATRLAEEKVREEMRDIVRGVVGDDDRFENYYQDVEEYRRQVVLPEEERPQEFAALEQHMTDFGKEVEARCEEAKERETKRLTGLPVEAFREVVRKDRIDSEASVASINAYYMWLGYICTHPGPGARAQLRVFPSLDAYRAAAAEVIAAIEDLVQDLETVLIRGEAAGN